MRFATAEEAARSIRQELVGAIDCDQLACDSALLRSCVWALTRGERPVHTLKLLNLAIELSPDALLSEEAGVPEERRSRLRGTLEELSEAGDLVSLANGRWLPAPTRQVPLRTGDDTRLLVGGVPTSALPSELARSIRHHGVFRRVTGDGLSAALALPCEGYESWVGEAPKDLQAWTRAVLDGTYEGFTETNDSGRFSFYAPQIARPGALQAKRWVDRPDKLGGRFLARRDLPFGIRQYRAAEIVDGRVVRVMLPRLGAGDLRRLMYGLDAIAGNPVLVDAELSAKEFVVVLASEVPGPERRLFAALGTLSVPPEKYYPRTWRFPVQFAAEIRNRLSALEVRLVSKGGSKAER
jgi:hypothetical protein